MIFYARQECDLSVLQKRNWVANQGNRVTFFSFKKRGVGWKGKSLKKVINNKKETRLFLLQAGSFALCGMTKSSDHLEEQEKKHLFIY